MGPKYDKDGLQDNLSGKTTKHIRPNKMATGPEEARIFNRIRKRIASETGNHHSPFSTAGKRRLFPNILGSQGIGRPQTSSGPEIAQPIYRSSRIQDGVHIHYHISDTAKRLDDINRSRRCISAHSNQQTPPEVSEVHFGRRPLSIQMLAFRNQHSSQSLLQSPVSHHRKYSSKRYKDLPLLRRHSGSSQINHRGDTTSRSGIADPRQVRLAGECPEESINTISKNGVPWPNIRHTRGTDLLTQSQSGRTHGLYRQHNECSCTVSKRLHDTPRNVYSSEPRSTVGKIPCKSFSDVIPTPVGWRILRSEDPVANSNPPEPGMVEFTGQLVAGHAPQPGGVDLDNFGCQSPGLGGPLPRQAGSGHVANNRDKTLQSPGVAGSLLSPACLRRLDSGSPGPTKIGQSDSSLLYSPAGRNHKPPFTAIDNQNFCLGRDTSGSIKTATYIPGRQNHLADHLSRNFPTSSEWAVNRRYLEPIFSEWGTPSVDLMATSENAQLPRFVTRFKNRKAIAQDAFSIPWTFPLVYIFPPFPLILKTLLKIAKEETHAILILPFWPRRPWFPLLLQMAAAPPIALPLKKDLLRQGQWTHQNPGRLQLAAWLLNQPDGGHRDSRRK